MYSIQTTPGFIIGSKPFGEAGKILSIFTRDFGLVSVRAQGIRLEKSKLRYHTQDQFFGHFSLVRGKEFWRLTSADSDNLKINGQGLMLRISLLLRRLLHGEEANQGLFDCIDEGRKFVASSGELDKDRSSTLESLLVIRILRHLGYVGGNLYEEERLWAGEISVELLDSLRLMRTKLNDSINKALKESHL